MVWRTIPGIVGKVYEPDTFEGGKKHPCADCYRCQGCGRERCQLCRMEKSATIEQNPQTLARRSGNE